jgi:hypothetical protein
MTGNDWVGAMVVPGKPFWFVGNPVEIMSDRSSELFDESIRAWVKVP